MILEIILVSMASVAGGTTVLGYHLGKKNRIKTVKAKKVAFGTVVNCESKKINDATVIGRTYSGEIILGLKQKHISSYYSTSFKAAKGDKYIDGVKSAREVANKYPHCLIVSSTEILEIVPPPPSEPTEVKTDPLLKEAEQEVEDFLNPPPPKETVPWSYNYVFGVSKCTKCKGYNRWRGKGYIICSCKDYARPHFHITCPHCEYKVIMKSADDSQAATDFNVCINS